MGYIIETRAGNELLADVSYASDYLLLADGWISQQPIIDTSGSTYVIKGNADLVINGKRIIIDSAGIDTGQLVSNVGSYYFWLQITIANNSITTVVTSAPTIQPSSGSDTADIYVNPGLTKNVLIGGYVNGSEDVNYKIKRAGGSIVDQVYPVGAIYLASNNTINPANLFPGTTWQALTPGFALVTNATGSSGSTQGTAIDGNGNVTTGGTAISVAQMPQHAHSSAAHTHSISFTSGNASQGHTHSFSANTNSAGTHSHQPLGNTGNRNHFVTSTNSGFATGAASKMGAWSTNGYSVPVICSSSGTGNNQFNSVNGTTEGGAHTHSVSGTTGGQSVSHNHSVSGNTGSTTPGNTGNQGSTQAHTHTSPIPNIKVVAWVRIS